MQKILYIAVLMLVSIACGMTAPSTLVDRDTVVAAEINSVEMVVTAYQLNVRDDANGEITQGFYLIQGDTVTVYDERAVGDLLWCRITPIENTPRWVACGWLVAK